MVTYCYDANAILVRPLRYRKGSELLEIIKNIHQYLETRGCKPNHQILVNESLTSLEDYLRKMAFHSNSFHLTFIAGTPQKGQYEH